MTKELPHIGLLPGFLKEEKEVYMVFDKNVSWVASQVLQALPVIKASIALETSEQLKTMDTVLSLERQLLEAGASRGALLLAVGGGITTDVAGFAASIYKRGIRWCALPTTLLAQVDAAIGGKTGVNLDGYKNMLGCFHMPEYTFLCPEVLRTLPPREYKAGVAELAKTFLLASSQAYQEALSGITPALVLQAAQIKADIVQRDPLEKGERAKLNLGHTFAHAIEQQAHEHGLDIMHGEAVAMGIILAAQLGESLGVSENGLCERLTADFKALGLPTECPFPLEALKAAMALDKKALGGGKVRFVLPVRPGEVVFQELNPYDLHFNSK